MDRSEFLNIAGLITAPSVLGAASTIAIQKVAAKYGHTFLPVGPAHLVGLIGAIQNLMGGVLSVLMTMKFDKTKGFGPRTVGCIVLGHILSSAILVGMSASALKMNLISSRISLLAGGVLCATSIIENCAFIMAVAAFTD